MAKDVITLS